MKNMTFEEAFHLQTNAVDQAWKKVLACCLDREWLNDAAPDYGKAKEVLEQELKKLWRLKQVWAEASDA